MNKKLLPPPLQEIDLAALSSLDGKDVQDLIHQWYYHAVKSQMIAAKLERKVIEQAGILAR